MAFSECSVDSFRFGGIFLFTTWSHCPGRQKFENKVVHPFSFEINHPPYFCPQLYRKRKRIKLKSLAWSRTHRKRLLSTPSELAKRACEKVKWKESASRDLWGGIWDEKPYNLWGMNQTYWYYQIHHLDAYEDFPWFNQFCSTLNPLAFHNLESQTNNLVSDLVVPAKARAFIAAHSIQSNPPDRLSSKFYSVTSDGVPVVIDSGASTSVTPFRDDFVDKMIPLKNETVDGITETASIEGVGTVEWKVFDDVGNPGTIRTFAYFMPKAKIRLFSPQKYFQERKFDGPCVLTRKGCLLTLEDGTKLSFDYDVFNNLPLGKTRPPSTSALSSVLDPLPEGVNVNTLLHHECNQNLTRSQKDLLNWHWRLGHASQTRVQGLMRKHPVTGHQIIVPTEKKATSCDHPMCTACRLAKANRNNSHLQPRHQAPEMMIRSEDLQPGDCVSVDQYVCNEKGRLPHTKGKEKDVKRYCGGFIAVDHASGFVHMNHQVSLYGGETVKCKNRFEKKASNFGVKILKYHGDNGIFRSNAWLNDCDKQGQRNEFPGVGAHHQNGVAERSIQTIASWARAMMIHAALHWPDQADIKLWPMAMTQAVHIWNHLPDATTGLAPVEHFSGSKLHSFECLKRLHVWGCPVFVLDPSLQDNKKLPKWKPRARLGQYLGVADGYASSVGQILNIDSGHISPQYHVVHDDYFTTVPASMTVERWADLGGLPLWEDLYELGSESYVEVPEQNVPARNDNNNDEVPERNVPARNNGVDIDDTADDLQFIPPLDMTWRNRTTEQQQPPEGASLQREYDWDSSDDSDDNNDLPPVTEHDTPASTPTPDPAPPTLRRSLRTRQPPARYLLDNLLKVRVTNSVLNQAFLNSLDWTNHPSADERCFFLANNIVDPDTGFVEDFSPLALSMKANSSDNPNWHQAMNGPLKDGYWNAMETEIDTLTEKGSWVVLDRQPGMNVLPSTWAFKCKRFPDGSVRKLKARFCVRGDKQKEGIDYFETYAPVVSWQTIRMLLILSIKLRLKSKQVDYTAAFVQSEIQEEVYVELPKGFPQKGNKVLKLQRCLYGLRQAPRNWFLHLKERLAKCHLVQSKSDPCLFVGKDVICLVWVDDCLFFSPKEEYIDKLLKDLKEKCSLDLNVEDDVAGFLGVNIDRREDGSIELTQSGLTQRIITALGLESTSNTAATPSETKALGSDPEGASCQESFSYASVVGMLMYLSNTTRPDLSFAVHQCARFTHSPKRSHEVALKRIGRYLIGTADKGMILKPNTDLNIDCFVDADFAGLWGSEPPDSPISVKSRSGYVIMVGGCPVIWASKMQETTALSTMQAEYVALSTAMRDLLPFKALMLEIATSIGLPHEDIAKIKTKVYEDNNGALILANLEPGRQTSRSKHFAIKFHWFREELEPNGIEILKIESKDQIADILTKGVTKDLFQGLRKMLLGW